MPHPVLEIGQLEPLGAQTITERTRFSALGLILQSEGLTTLLEWAKKENVQGLKNHYHPFDWCGLCGDLLSDPAIVRKILAVFATQSNLRRLAMLRLALLGDNWYIEHLKDLT